MRECGLGETIVFVQCSMTWPYFDLDSKIVRRYFGHYKFFAHFLTKCEQFCPEMHWIFSSVSLNSEPPPTFVWTHPRLGDLSSNEDFTVLHEEYQGGSTTTLVIHHAKNSDKGTYSLTAENRNGKEKVDLDLIVLDTLPDGECDLFLHANKMCSCSLSYTG